MTNLDSLQRKYNKLNDRKEYLESNLNTKTKSVKITNSRIKDLNEVHTIWIQIAKEIQINTTRQIETIVTSAIQTVFKRNYKFKLRFEEKYKTITCTPLVIENDIEYSPKDSMGGAMLDIIGFALRITLQAIQTPQTRNIFILDEQFRFSGDLTRKMGVIMKSLSKSLNFQVLLVTHNEDLKHICDRTWTITNRKLSRVIILKEIVDNFIRTIKRRRK